MATITRGKGVAKEKPADTDNEPSGFQKLSSSITLIGALLGIVITINTLLMGWIARASDREKSFVDAVRAEEAYWRDRYNDYIAVFNQSLTPGERRARLFALQQFTGRPAPTFAEFNPYWDFWGQRASRAEASQRIAVARQQLHGALADPRISDPSVASEQQGRNFDAALETGGQDRGQRAQTQVAEVAVPTVVSDDISYSTQVISAGDPRGWDFDIFWCGSGNLELARLNYRQARAVALLLGQLPTVGGQNSQERRGRIRLATLPPARQGRDGLPTAGIGIEIRPDVNDRAEQAIAASVIELLATRSVGVRRVSNDSPRRTQWYVSLFVCHGRSPAPAGGVQNRT